MKPRDRTLGKVEIRPLKTGLITTDLPLSARRATMLLLNIPVLKENMAVRTFFLVLIIIGMFVCSIFIMKLLFVF